MSSSNAGIGIAGVSNLDECKLSASETKRMQRVAWPERFRSNGGLYKDHLGERREGVFAVLAFVGASFRIMELYPSEKAANEAVQKLMQSPDIHSPDELTIRRTFDLFVAEVSQPTFIPVPGIGGNKTTEETVASGACKTLYADEMVQQFFAHHIESNNKKLEEFKERLAKTETETDYKGAAAAATSGAKMASFEDPPPTIEQLTSMFDQKG